MNENENEILKFVKEFIDFFYNEKIIINENIIEDLCGLFKVNLAGITLDVINFLKEIDINIINIYEKLYNVYLKLNKNGEKKYEKCLKDERSNFLLFLMNLDYMFENIQLFYIFLFFYNFHEKIKYLKNFIFCSTASFIPIMKEALTLRTKQGFFFYMKEIGIEYFEILFFITQKKNMVKNGYNINVFYDIIESENNFKDAKTSIDKYNINKEMDSFFLNAIKEIKDKKIEIEFECFSYAWCKGYAYTVKEEIIPIDIKFRNNDCFFISLLQGLSRIDELSAFFDYEYKLRYKEFDCTNECLNKHKLCYLLSCFFSIIRGRPRIVLFEKFNQYQCKDLKFLKDLIYDIFFECGHYYGLERNVQDDITILMQSFINNIWNIFEINLCTQFFGYETTTTLYDKTHTNESETKETGIGYVILQTPNIEKNLTLYELLNENFEKEEKLKDNKVYASKKAKLEILSNNILINISKISKNNILIYFDNILTIDNINYKIKAISTYSGDIKSGHYSTIVEYKNRWILLDTFSAIWGRRIIDKSKISEYYCYFIFYEKDSSNSIKLENLYSNGKNDNHIFNEENIKNNIINLLIEMNPIISNTEYTTDDVLIFIKFIKTLLKIRACYNNIFTVGDLKTIKAYENFIYDVFKNLGIIGINDKGFNEFENIIKNEKHMISNIYTQLYFNKDKKTNKIHLYFISTTKDKYSINK